MRTPHAIAAIGMVLSLIGGRGAAAAGPQAGAVLAMFGQCIGESDGGRQTLSLGDPVFVAETLDVAAGAKRPTGAACRAMRSRSASTAGRG